MADERRDRKITTDRETIQNWADERNAVPVWRSSTEARGEGRYEFVRENELDVDRHERHDWDEFHNRFEEEKQAFRYGEHPEGGLGEHEFVDRDEHVGGDRGGTAGADTAGTGGDRREGTETTTAADVSSDTGVGTDTAGGTETESRAGTDAGIDRDSGTGAEAGTETDTNVGAGTETQTGTTTGTGTDADIDTGTRTDVGTGTGTDPDTGMDTDTSAGTGMGTDTSRNTDRGTEAERGEPFDLSKREEGKMVVDDTGRELGMITDVDEDDGAIYVDPDPSLTDKIKATLHWGGPDEDAYRLDRGQIESVENDRVVVRKPRTDESNTTDDPMSTTDDERL